MKIICLVKIIPDVDKIVYDFNTNKLNRADVKNIVNPDDGAALEMALLYKDEYGAEIEVVTMGPMYQTKYLEDLIRVGVDKATLLCDTNFSGSDTLITSKIICSYLKKQKFDYLLSGNQSLDGDTGHVGPQVAALLDLNQYSSCKAIDFKHNECIIEFEESDVTIKYNLPIVLSVKKIGKMRLRYVRYDDLKKDVSSKLQILDSKSLDCYLSGINDSPTVVSSVSTVTHNAVAKKIIYDIDEAIVEFDKFIAENRG